MVIGKIPFFLILFFILTIPLVTPRLIWIVRSRKTFGVMGFEGRGTAGEQIPNPGVVPWGSGLLLTLKSPYIRLWSIHPN
jgi:hypothetical protein